MPTRTQTAKRPGEGRFARTAGKPAQRSAGGRRVGSTGRPTIVRRRQPEKSGAAKVVDKLTGMLPGMPGKKSKRGAAGGRSKKGTAGLALLAGAAGLVMKNRDKLTSRVHRGDSSNEAVDRVEPRPVADVPVSPEAPDARPLGANDQPTT
jgi:hypothetical protein